jgi:hypothetical protein
MVIKEWIRIMKETDGNPCELSLHGSRTYFFRCKRSSLKGELLGKLIGLKLGFLDKIQSD